MTRHGVPVDFFCARLQRDLMDRLGIERSHLYGSSAFSPAALRFGLEYPERVGKIVIQAYAPGHEPGLTEGIRSLVDFAADPHHANSDLTEDIAALRAEVLVVWGARDGMIPIEEPSTRWAGSRTTGHCCGEATAGTSSPTSRQRNSPASSSIFFRTERGIRRIAPMRFLVSPDRTTTGNTRWLRSGPHTRHRCRVPDAPRPEADHIAVCPPSTVST
ncbi:alpha/beta fold hydrolase [Pseudonocardia benzenivorans]